MLPILRTFRVWFGAIVVCLPLYLSAAEPENIRFNHLSRQQGLSQSFILSVTQDKDGYMWFGSQSGLNKFDGYDVKVFTRDDSGPGFSVNGLPGSGLPDNSVRALLSDSKGRLWVGTDNGGFAQYNFDTESFTTYDSSNSRLPIDRIRVLYEDTSGQIWVGTDGAGLWLFDPNQKTLTEASKLLQDASVWALTSGKNGDLWLGTQAGLFRLSSEGWLVTGFEGEPIGDLLKGQHIRAVHRESDGTLWIGTDAAGAYRISNDGSFQQFLPGLKDGFAISGQQVTKIFSDDRGDIWIASYGGLDHYSKGRIQSHRADASNAYSLSNDIVIDIYQDRGGVMWIGTFGGLNYWARTEYFASHVGANQHLLAELSSTLSSPAVTSFSESADGTIWVGTFGGGLNEVMPGGMIRRHRANIADPAAIPDDNVMSLFVDSRNRLWVGTRSAGVALFDSKLGVVKRLHADDDEPNQLSSNAITSITESARGEILVGTYGAGFNRVGLESFEVTAIKAGPDSDDLQSDRIMTIFEDSAGRIWLGTDGAGLAYYDLENNKFQHYQKDIDSGFTGDFVLTINEDTLGNVFFGTLDSGLFSLAADKSPQQGIHFEQISDDEGLVSNSVYGLLVDRSNAVWVSSNAGVSRIDRQSGDVYHLDLHNNLQDLEFNAGAAYKLRSGELLFGGVNGFNRINPSQVETNTHAPPVVITSVAKQGSRLSTSILGDKGVQLSHQDYSLEFSFAGLDYANPARNQYRYRLVGFEESWVDARNRRYASYTNLEPGNYVFEVLAANSDGVWGTEPARLAVTVMPAPWVSWWAYLCYGLILSFVALLVYRAYRVRRDHIAEIRAINERLRLEVDVRTQAEVEINQEREKTQRYLDVAEVALVALDVEGLVLHINEKASNTFSNEANPFVHQNLMDFVAVQHRNDMRQMILAIFDGEDNGEHLECEMRDGAGQPRTMIWRFAPLSESAGHANMILASGTDITELRQLEKSVRSREKLSALGTLSAGITHDFNNILTAITGYSSLALEQVKGQGEVEDFVRRIGTASQRASELVARILSVTQINEKQFEPLNVSSVIRDAVGLLRGSLPAEISIDEIYAAERLMVNGDASQLQQLILNLGANANTAMQGGRGELTISVNSRDLESDTIPVGANLQSGLHVVVEVIDTGKGMAPAVQQRIFDPFYSSDGMDLEDRLGAGLGLSIVHGIVLAHRGHIEVQSEEGRGTQFRVYLPVNDAVARSKVVPLAAARLVKYSVMLVDDEDWVVDVASRLLTNLGHKVQSFKHPLDALEQFRTTPEAFDLVITDQHMPQMKGTELIEALRRTRADIKILLMSGNTSPLQAPDDITHFMPKPFMPAVLKAALEALGIETDAGRSSGKHSS